MHDAADHRAGRRDQIQRARRRIDHRRAGDADFWRNIRRMRRRHGVSGVMPALGSMKLSCQSTIPVLASMAYRLSFSVATYTTLCMPA